MVPALLLITGGLRHLKGSVVRSFSSLMPSLDRVILGRLVSECLGEEGDNSSFGTTFPASLDSGICVKRPYMYVHVTVIMITS